MLRKKELSEKLKPRRKRRKVFFQTRQECFQCKDKKKEEHKGERNVIDEAVATVQ